MDEFEDKDRKLFEQFKELHSQAQSEEGTGDASLDMLLHTAEPSFSQLIQNLAISHWFDEEVVAAVGNGGSATKTSEILEDVVDLPFVRSHAQGYAYHDVVRETLRRYLARKDPDQFRKLSKRLAEIFADQSERERAEEIDWERVYHTLVCNEEVGFDALDTLFMDARRNRRLTVSDTLVNMAEEQRALLSPQGNAWVDYYRGLLAFDLRNWEMAEILFQDSPTVELPVSLAGRIQLYRGLTLEAQGKWQQAEQVYRTYLERINGTDVSLQLSARFYQRLAQTDLSIGDLENAEVHVQMSLTANQKSGARYGEALNFETLGRIYEKLRDLPRAQEALEKSLTILGEAGWEFEQARIYSDLAALYLSFGKWDDAERYYRQAQQVKADAGDNYGLAFIYSNLGNLYLKKDDTDTALRHFRTSLSIFRQFKDHLNSAKIFRNIALTYERLNDITSALDYMRQAVQELPLESPWKAPYQKEIIRLEHLRYKHSDLGIASFINSLVIITASIFSGATASDGSLLITGFVMGLVGVGLGIAGLRQKNRKNSFSVLGITLNTVIILGFVALMVT